EVAIKEYHITEYSHYEIENYKKLNGLPIIPKLYDHFNEGNYSYIVMQLIKSKNLNQSWLDNGSWSYYWSTLIHVITVIRDLHRAGFYHGDLHPENLIWDDKMYIIDFDRVG